MGQDVKRSPFVTIVLWTLMIVSIAAAFIGSLITNQDRSSHVLCWVSDTYCHLPDIKYETYMPFALLSIAGVVGFVVTLLIILRRG